MSLHAPCRPRRWSNGSDSVAKGLDLAKLIGDGRIATGDVKAVPVGLYAKGYYHEAKAAGLLDETGLR